MKGKMLIPKNIKNDELKFIIYNLVMSETAGEFTVDSIHRKLSELSIEREKSFLHNLFTQWLNDGLLFESGKGYIINTFI